MSAVAGTKPRAKPASGRAPSAPYCSTRWSSSSTPRRRCSTRGSIASGSALIADDIHYWMPIRRTVTLSDIDREFTKPGDMAYFDDDRAMLEMRVKKLEAGSAWSEDPPSRSRHFVSNVRILSVAGDEITVEVSFHLYRTRLNSEVEQLGGAAPRRAAARGRRVPAGQARTSSSTRP